MEHKQRFGIFGGTFDPVHNGHVALAKRILEAGLLDQIFLVVSKDPPHKISSAGAAHRLNMVKLACEGKPGMVACDVELRNPERSYAIYTIQTLLREHPGAELTFIGGSDLFPTIFRWHRSHEFLPLIQLLCVRRRSDRLFNVQESEALAEELGTSIRFLELDLPDISSSTVRRRVFEGRSLEGYVPAQVARYIIDHRLYLQAPSLL